MWIRDSGDEPVLRGQNNYISWSQGRAEMVPGSPFFEWQLPWWGGRDPGSWSMMEQGGLMSAPSPPGPILLSFIHSLIYSLPTQFTHSPSHLFIHWFIHSLILLPIQFTHSPIHIHSPTHSFAHLLIHSFIQLLIYSFIYSPTHSFPHKFTHSSIHSFPDSLIHILTLEELPLLGTDPMRRFLTRLL